MTEMSGKNVSFFEIHDIIESMIYSSFIRSIYDR